MTPHPIITDAHTHCPTAAQAVISVGPEEFSPKPGLLYSVGIHPWRSGSPGVSELLPLLERYASHRQVVAVGETGLDPLRGAPLDVQLRLMQAHVAIASAAGKPLVVHCVRMSQQVLRLWRDTAADRRTPWMVHGFRGNERVLKPLAQAGIYIGYGMRFNAAALQATPRGQLLIETDDSPLGIDATARAVALSLGTTPQAIKALAQANATQFFFPPTAKKMPATP